MTETDLSDMVLVREKWCEFGDLLVTDIVLLYCFLTKEKKNLSILTLGSLL